MSDKFGFVYIWRDRKHKRYYVGCHWGNIDDGYICSSRWMRKSYRRRPKDFKRRILSVHKTREEMRNEENRILSMISSIELGKKYYNIYNHGFNHWSTDEIKRHIISEKISKATKGGKHSKKREYTSEGLERVRNNTREIQKLRVYHETSEETKEKQRARRIVYFQSGGEKTNSGSFTKGQKAWNEGRKSSDETKAKLSESKRGRIFIHNPITIEEKMVFSAELEGFITKGFIRGRLKRFEMKT